MIVNNLLLRGTIHMAFIIKLQEICQIFTNIVNCRLRMIFCKNS